MLDSQTVWVHTLYMARTASPAALPETLTAVDANGEDFALDFGFETLPGARPAKVAPETDVTAAKLAYEVVRNTFRAEKLGLT